MTNAEVYEFDSRVAGYALQLRATCHEAAHDLLSFEAFDLEISKNQVCNQIFYDFLILSWKP